MDFVCLFCAVSHHSDVVATQHLDYVICRKHPAMGTRLFAGKMKFLEVIVILTIALAVVWSAGDNQDEDDDQDHSIWPTHEFIVKKTQWNTGSLK
jgi:hypothetical protein